MRGVRAVELSAALFEWTAAAQCGPVCQIHCSFGTPRCAGPAPIHTGSPDSLGTGRPPTYASEITEVVSRLCLHPTNVPH